MFRMKFNKDLWESVRFRMIIFTIVSFAVIGSSCPALTSSNTSFLCRMLRKPKLSPLAASLHSIWPLVLRLPFGSMKNLVFWWFQIRAEYFSTNNTNVPSKVKASVKKFISASELVFKISNLQDFFYIFTESYSKEYWNFSVKNFYSYFSSFSNRSSRQSIHIWWFYTLLLFEQTKYNICW